MTRRFFAAQPLSQAIPGNDLTMSLQLAKTAAPTEPIGTCACTENLVILGWHTDLPSWDLLWDTSPLIYPPLYQMPIFVWYPKVFLYSVGGTVCGSMDDIIWVAEASINGVVVDPLDTNLSFYPYDLTGPRIAIHAVYQPPETVTLTMTAFKSGVQIGEPLILQMS